MIIAYNKNTKQIESIVVPNEGEVLNKDNIRLFDYQDILVVDKKINGYPNVHELQKLLNELL